AFFFFCPMPARTQELPSAASSGSHFAECPSGSRSCSASFHEKARFVKSKAGGVTPAGSAVRYVSASVDYDELYGSSRFAFLPPAVVAEFVGPSSTRVR